MKDDDNVLITSTETISRGRPTKYNDQVQAKADDYVEGDIHEWVDKGGNDRESVTYGDKRSVIPSAEGLAKHLGVATSTIYLWGEKHAIFSETLARIQDEQKNITLNEGLKGEFNATIAKLVLANHGMHDKVDKSLSGKVETGVIAVPMAQSREEAEKSYK